VTRKGILRTARTAEKDEGGCYCDLECLDERCEGGGVHGGVAERVTLVERISWSLEVELECALLNFG
jgi:hypothetical protein